MIIQFYVPQHLDRASTLLQFGFAMFPLFSFSIFHMFSLFFAVFPMFFFILLLGFSVFPLLSLILCLVPMFFLYFLYIFLSTLSIIYRLYLQNVLRSSCLCSFIGRLILRRISIILVKSLIFYLCLKKI